MIVIDELTGRDAREGRRSVSSTSIFSPVSPSPFVDVPPATNIQVTFTNYQYHRPTVQD